MQASKKIPFEDPTVLNGIRAVYIISNLIIAGIYFYIQTKINAKKGTFTVRQCTSCSDRCTDKTTLKYVEPAAMGSTDEPKLVTTTVQAYDSSKLKEAFRGQLMGVLMMGVMHLYFKYTNPLLIQVSSPTSLRLA